jgi:hypothetical protein
LHKIAKTAHYEIRGLCEEAANLTHTDFLVAIARIVDELRDLQLDSELEKRLNERFLPDGEQFARLAASNSFEHAPSRATKPDGSALTSCA